MDFPDGLLTASSDRGYELASVFDDYAHRGPHLAPLCVYDYYSLVYKSKGQRGLKFDALHRQSSTSCQVVRGSSSSSSESSFQIPNLLGKFLFMKKNSSDEHERNEYCCLLTSMFVPWSFERPPNPFAVPWQDWLGTCLALVPPRVERFISNLDLLHKSRSEVDFHRLQLAALTSIDDDTQYRLEDHDESDDPQLSGMSEREGPVPWAEGVEIAHSPSDKFDGYVMDGLEASAQAGYLPESAEEIGGVNVVESVLYSPVPLSKLYDLVDSRYGLAVADECTLPYGPPPPVVPHVYLSDRAELCDAMRDMIDLYHLNAEQALVFKIVASHSFGFGPRSGDQLLLGLFGAGGTGKSQVIRAITAWFAKCNRANELLLTATTGSAAIKVAGCTVHSAIGMSLNGNLSTAPSQASLRLWRDKSYLIVDEVSMLDCFLIAKIHAQLTKMKHDPDKLFGGVNILWTGDFLQLPSVGGSDLYISGNGRTDHGHRLWRRLSAVVILTEQMRQAGDPRYTGMLGRIRLRCPTDMDYRLLCERVAFPLPGGGDCPVTIVRRNKLRDALNLARLKAVSAENGTPIMNCMARIVSCHKDISDTTIWSIKHRSKPETQDAVLSLIPGCPLMITKNSKAHLSLVNGSVVEFCGFSGAPGSVPRGNFAAPDYMLVRIPVGPGSDFQISPAYPVGVVPLEPVEFTFDDHGRKVKLRQFPVTLGYTLTDYKCQGSTFPGNVIVDLYKPSGACPAASPYVQLSRATALDKVFILRPFDKAELEAPISTALRDELDWEAKMAAETKVLYSDFQCTSSKGLGVGCV